MGPDIHAGRDMGQDIYEVGQPIVDLGEQINPQFSSVTQSCPTLCDPMKCSTPGLPVHHHLLEFTQTHVHRVHDAIQPSHPRSSPSPLAPNPSQHQSLFQSVNSHKNRPWERSKTRSLRKQKPISTGYKVSGKGNWKEM